jgi:hypothetical protein
MEKISAGKFHGVPTRSHGAGYHALKGIADEVID